MSRPTISERLAELRNRSIEDDKWCEAERWCLRFIQAAGYEDERETIHYDGSQEERFKLWAAESLLFAVRAARGGRWAECLRAWGQAKEYRGRVGGFLPSSLSDVLTDLQNAIEGRLGPR